MMSKTLAEHIQAQHAAREAFIQCESDRVLAKALRSRCYARGEEIHPGDWVYYKNKTKRWEGPVKITTKDGKLLFCVRGGKLLTINSDHAVLVKSRDEVVARQDVELTGTMGTIMDCPALNAVRRNESEDEEATVDEMEEVPEVQDAGPFDFLSTWYWG